MNSYSGHVFWHDQSVEVVVVQAEGVPRIGMRLLWSGRLTLEAKGGRSVVIEELST